MSAGPITMLDYGSKGEEFVENLSGFILES
jgi:hypothetical protein